MVSSCHVMSSCHLMTMHDVIASCESDLILISNPDMIAGHGFTWGEVKKSVHISIRNWCRFRQNLSKKFPRWLSETSRKQGTWCRCKFFQILGEGFMISVRGMPISMHPPSRAKPIYYISPKFNTNYSSYSSISRGISIIISVLSWLTNINIVHIYLFFWLKY